MNKPEIFIISTEFPPGPGGIGKHAYDLARSLSAFGYKVLIFTSQDYCSDEEAEIFNKSLEPGITVIRFKRSGYTTYFNRLKLIMQHIRKRLPELVLVSGRFSLWAGGAIKMMFGSRITVQAFVHGSETVGRLGVMTRMALNRADKIIAVSEFTKRKFSLFTGRNDILLLPNGIHPSDWVITESDKKLTGEPSLLTVGRISKRKGQQRVVKNLPALLTVYKNLHYHMAGIPADQQSVEDLAHELHLSRHITVHGKVRDTKALAEYYSGADIFMMLSENQPDGDAEGFGIAILEANLFGVPAIGASGTGVEEAIKDGYNGRIIDGNDQSAMLEAVNDIMLNYEEYSRRSVEWAMRHDWKIIGAQYLQMNNKLLHQQQPERV